MVALLSQNINLEKCIKKNCSTTHTLVLSSQILSVVVTFHAVLVVTVTDLSYLITNEFVSLPPPDRFSCASDSYQCVPKEASGK